MKKAILVFFFVVSGLSWSNHITFIKRYSVNTWESGHSVQQTTDGGYIIVGTTQTILRGKSYVFLIKTDTEGDIK